MGKNLANHYKVAKWLFHKCYNSKSKKTLNQLTSKELMLERKIMIKMHHNRLYKKTNKCFDDILWMYKQVSTKYTKLNSSVIVLSASK